jgi:hypothetical protein
LVTDDGIPPLTATNRFTVVVTEVNAAPVLDAIGPQPAIEGVPLAFTVTAGDPDDLPANRVALSATGLPEGAAFDPATGQFTWTPAEIQGSGVYPVTFTATDDGSPALGDSETVAITVAEVNQAPTLDPVVDQTATPGQPLEVQLVGRDPDRPANVLRYTALTGPNDATLDAALGRWTWTPPLGEAGQTRAVTVEVADDAPVPLSAQVTFQVRVRQVRPELPAEEVMITEGGFRLTFRAEPGLRFVVEASDDLVQWVERETLTVSVDGTAAFTDPVASGEGHRFYRLRWEP